MKTKFSSVKPDARILILQIILVSVMSFSVQNALAMMAVFAVVDILCIEFLGIKEAGKNLVTYICLWALLYILNTVNIPFISLIFPMFMMLMIRVLPAYITCQILVRKTPMNELLAALRKLHIPMLVLIPVEKLKKEGYTVVVSEHKLYYLKNLADRVILLKDGKIAEEISGEEFAKKTTVWFKENGLRRLELAAVKSEKPKWESWSRDTIFRAENLSFWYNRKSPLWENVSFEAKRGDIIGVLGANGAGKSTLFRVLMGLEKPKKGQIFLNDKKAGKKDRRKISSYVMQDVDYQLFASTVLEETRKLY